MKKNVRRNRTKKIYLCDCNRCDKCPKILDIKSKRLVEVDKEDRCIHCGLYAVKKLVEQDWDPSQPIYGFKSYEDKWKYYKDQRIDERFIYCA